MRILLTGATGYIGKRLLPVLAAAGHTIICCTREKSRFKCPTRYADQIEVLEIDFLDMPPLEQLPKDIDIAFYLIHSMRSGTRGFEELEAQSAENFTRYLNATRARQVIYLSGMVNEESLSQHLQSRKGVEDILSEGQFALTVLRASIVIGSGSASFEIIRDLVEKLPLMIAPKWVLTKSQPIAIRDVIQFLIGVMDRRETFDQNFDIGGPDILSYRGMLKEYAQVRGLKRYFITVPVMTPRLSSYWLYFITSTSYPLAVNLVDSMKMEMVSRDHRLQDLLGIEPLSYKEAIEAAFTKIEQNVIISSWKDSMASGQIEQPLSEFVEIPKLGCFVDHRARKVKDRESVIKRIWAIGGDTGWYYANFLWRIRGFLDKVGGGVGLRRGRTHPTELHPGDSLDFWRVIYADKQEGRLLLYAEMKLPGEAWLEFCIDDAEQQLHQTATFRPKGLWGRLYWYLVLPFHFFIFRKMADRVVGIA